MQKKGVPNPEELEKRTEVINLINSHIEEVEQLDKKRFGAAGARGSDRGQLMGSAGKGFGRHFWPDRTGFAQKKTAVETELQPIDPDVQQELLQIQKRDQDLVPGA